MILHLGIGFVLGVFAVAGIKGGVAWFKARAEQAKALAEQAKDGIKS